MKRGRSARKKKPGTNEKEKKIWMTNTRGENIGRKYATGNSINNLVGARNPIQLHEFPNFEYACA